MSFNQKIKQDKMLHEQIIKTYGLKFDIIVTRIMPIVLVILVTGLWLVSQYISKKYDDSKIFILDNESKYIIYDNDVSTDRDLYYEVDFDKNKIVYRENTERFKREKIRKVKKEKYSEIKIMIEKIISDKDNLINIPEEDRTTFFRNNVYQFYAIEDYKGNLYYIKNIEQTKELKQLLE